MDASSPRTQREAFTQALRADFPTFIEMTFRTLNPGDAYDRNWHILAMADALKRLRSGECRRLIITVPPRHLKSITTSVAFPAWCLGQEPELKFLVTSYGSELSNAHARHFRAVVQSQWYRSAFPEVRLTRSPEADVETSRGGFRKALSLEGAGTGFGADIIIVDDMMKAADAASPIGRSKVQSYYTETLLSRLNNKMTGRIVCIQQRLHEDDLVGFLLERGGFEHLNLPAIAEEEQVIALGAGRTLTRRPGEVLWPAREPRCKLDEFRIEMGASTFSAQYQQNPVAPESNLINYAAIQRYDEAPDPIELELVVLSFYTSTTSAPGSDYTVCTVWGFHEKSWLLVDLYRQKHEYSELLAAVRLLRSKWRADVLLIERASTGIPLVQELLIEQKRQAERKSNFTWRVLGITPRSDKATRFSAVGEKLERGFARLPRQAPWLDGLRKELTAFPKAKHDDQVDSVSQFLEWAGHPRRANGPREGRPLGRVPRERLHSSV